MPVRGKLTTQEKFAAQLLALGHSLAEAAQRSDIPLPSLRRACDHPLFDAEFKRLQMATFPELSARLAARLEQLQEPALEHVNHLMTHAASEPVQLNAAKALLDKGPLGPARQGQSQGGGALQITLDQQALQAILSGALNAGQHGIIAAFSSLQYPQVPAEVPRIIDIDEREP